MGPVFVSIPVDDWDRECEMPVLPALSLRTLPDPAGIAELAAMLDGASRPALVLGTGVARCGGWQAAIALAEASGAAVWTAPFAARETFPEDHPQFAGFLPAFREEIVRLLSPHDAILVAGAPAFTYHAEGFGPHWPERAALGLLSEDPQHLSFLPGGIGVLGDVGAGLASLAAQVRRRDPPARIAAQPAPLPGMTAAYVLSRIAALRPAAIGSGRGSADRAQADARSLADHQPRAGSTPPPAAASAMACPLRSASPAPSRSAR